MEKEGKKEGTEAEKVIYRETGRRERKREKKEKMTEMDLLSSGPPLKSSQ